jgi:transposase
MQGKKNFTPKLFHSFQLSERVPESSYYHQLLLLLDVRWLYKATSHLYGSTGNPSLDPVVLFKFMLVGYMENIISTRQLVEHCSMRMDILLFLGYDIDEPLPWHSTISRSRQLYGEEIFEKLFSKIVEQCIEKGLVAGHTQCIDSALIKANASLASLEPKRPVKRIGVYLSEVQTQDPDEETITPDQGGNPHQSGANKTIKGNLKNRSNTDPDARLSQKPGKPWQLYYMSSMSVDTHYQVITHIQSDYADTRDSSHLQGIVASVADRLEKSNLSVETIVADTNYSSGENYTYLEGRGMTGFIPVHGKFKNVREGFVYDEQENSFSCRNNKELSYKRTFTGTTGEVKNEYRASAKDCGGCPFKSTCLTGKSKEKRLEMTVHHKIYKKAYERQHSYLGRKMKSLRSATVEPVFGQLIHYRGLRKISTKRKSEANKCMIMAAIAHNLKKLLKFTTKKIEAKVHSMLKKLSSDINPLKAIYLALYLN